MTILTRLATGKLIPSSWLEPSTDHEALERFVIDNPDLQELEGLLGGFNFFEAVGAVRREERHSDFLAFLLEPQAPHGLGASFLSQFLVNVLDKSNAVDPALSRLEASLLDLGDIRVTRETHGIDILLISEAARLVILIENKVDTDEHSNQLSRYLEICRERYSSHRVVPVFLTRDGHDPSAPEYHALAYSDVSKLVARILSSASAISADVQVALRHYMETLQRHIVEDSDIAQLAKKIYSKHRRALDILFEHRPDDQLELMQELEKILRGNESVAVLQASKSAIQFIPSEWVDLSQLQCGDGSWAKRSDLLRYEIRHEDRLYIKLIIGPGDQSVREDLYALSGQEKHKRLFRNRTKPLYKRWTSIWRERIIDRKPTASMPIEDKIARVHNWWVDFQTEHLRPHCGLFLEHLKKS